MIVIVIVNKQTTRNRIALANITLKLIVEINFIFRLPKLVHSESDPIPKVILAPSPSSN